jgi:hypothetical protein
MTLTQKLWSILVLFNSGIQFRVRVSIWFTVLPHGVTTLQSDPLWVNWNVWQTSVCCGWNPTTMTCNVNHFTHRCTKSLCNKPHSRRFYSFIKVLVSTLWKSATINSFILYTALAVIINSSCVTDTDSSSMPCSISVK